MTRSGSNSSPEVIDLTLVVDDVNSDFEDLLHQKRADLDEVELAPIMEDTIPDETVDVAREATSNVFEQQLIDALSKSLFTPKERESIRWRYGLGTGLGGMTLLEVGEIIGVSGERVRDLEKNALKKLRTLKLLQ